MKALITGGAGFIGYHLTKELLQADYDVVLVDNFARGVEDKFLKELEKNPHVTFYSKDLLDRDAVMEMDKDFDYIYHLAAIIGVKNVLEHPYEVLEKNVVLLLNMVEFARVQKHLKRIVFTSTSEVYAGTLQFFEMEIPTPESTPLTITPLDHPRTSYMLSKIYGEALLQQSRLPFTIIRPHNFYGPRMGMSHVVPELLKKAYFAGEGQKLEVFSVNHKRSFCYIEDAVKIIRKLAEAEAALGQVYNIGNESTEVTIGEVAEVILKVTGRSLEIDARPATAGSPVRRCPSMKKTTAVIEYTGKVSLEEGVRRTFDWYKEYIFDGNEVGAK